jgi:hypothetical protein
MIFILSDAIGFPFTFLSSLLSDATPHFSIIDIFHRMLFNENILLPMKITQQINILIVYVLFKWSVGKTNKHLTSLKA